MSELFWLTGILAAVLALIHIAAERLRFLDAIPRSVWLSTAGGASVAYVFIHLLPDLAEQQRVFEESENPAINLIENHIYLLALIGLVIFYGVERAVKTGRKEEGGEGTSHTGRIFWIHIASFTLYNALIGYLLVHRESERLVQLFLFAFAIGLHFIVNDYGLRQDHKAAYHNVGRWILAAAVLIGWALGWLIDVNDLMLAVLFSFLAGGIVLNVLKEELPEDRESRFWAFASGAAVYSIILLLL